MNNEEEILQELSSLSDFNMRGVDGNTFLTCAVQAECASVVAYFLSKEVDLHTRNYAGVSAFDLALQTGNEQIKQMLLAAEQRNPTGKETRD